MSEISRFNIRMPSELSEWLDDEAARIGISKNAVVMLAVENYRKEKEVLSRMADMGELVAKIEQLEKAIQRSDPE